MTNSLIISFVANLMFVTRIEQVAESLGYKIHWIENADQLAAAEEPVLRRQLGEPLFGQEGVLIDQLSRLGPALILLDLGNAGIPWERWLPILKTVPATRRIPLIAFGSHVDVDTLKRARQLGADEVVARSRFLTALPDLIEKFARRKDEKALAESCHEPLHPKAIAGMLAFNRSKFFEAHELLEEAWREDASRGRDLYRAILQIAVAYYHIQQLNYTGALKMFLRVRQWIDPLPAVCRGVQVAILREQAFAAQDALLDLGMERMSEFDQNLLRPVEWNARNAEK